MADNNPSQTPAATPATEANQPVGATPPENAGTLTDAQREEILAKVSAPRGENLRDPLFADPEASDPLFTQGQEADPLLANLDPAEEPTEEAPEQSEATEEQPAEEEPAQQEAEKEEGRKRININRKIKAADGTEVPAYDPQTKSILRHIAEMADEGVQVSWQQALIDLGIGQTPTPKEQPQEQKAEQPAEKTVAEIDELIRAKAAERKKAAENINTELMANLSDEIDALRDERLEARERESRRVQEKQQQGTKLEQAITASEENALKRYPDLNVPGSEMFTGVSKLVKQYQDAGVAFEHLPNWPEMFAAQVAAEKGITPTTATPKAAPARQAPAPKARATPLLSPGSVTAATPAKNIQADLSQRMRAAREAGDMPALERLAKEVENLRAA